MIKFSPKGNEEDRGKFSLKLSIFDLKDCLSVHYNVLHSFLENEYWNVHSFMKWQSLEDYHCFLKCLFVAKLETGNLLSTCDFLKIYFIFGCARSLKEHGFFSSSCGKQGLLCSCGTQVSSHCGGFSCCGAQALGCVVSVAVAQAQELRCRSFVAPRHVGFSPIRHQTQVSCIGR